MSKRAGYEVRTSASHPIQVNWLPAAIVDRVGLTFAPGKKGRSNQGFQWDRDLATDLTALVETHHVDVLVSLMESAELADKGIPDLIQQAKAHGIAVLHLPIRDLGAPVDRVSVDRLLERIEAHVAGGQRVAIHCLGGIGRTGTIATCLLVKRGVSLEDSLRIVRETRCTNFPESAAQRRFIDDYPAHLAALSRTTETGRARSAQPAQKTTLAMPWALLGSSDQGLTNGKPARSHAQVCELLTDLERQIKASPSACFTINGEGYATLSVAGQSYQAGRFEVPTVASLAERIRVRDGLRATPGSVRLSILRGTGPHTDIGALQATAPDGVLFQVASQFNCLEAPGSHVVEVCRYPFDATQGPRASVSAFPGTFLRHYFAPRAGEARFVQTDQDCINLLAAVLHPHTANVKSGYLTSHQIKDPDALAAELEAHLDQIHVGLHDGVEVVLGTDWGGAVSRDPRPRIAQAFTSTIALGGYSRDDGSRALATIRQQLLRAAYLGTLLGAIALGKHTVVLTLIGGGAFGNSHRAIWDAIHWAVAEAEPQLGGTLDVIVNVRTDTVDEADQKVALDRGGMVIELSDHEIRIRR